MDQGKRVKWWQVLIGVFAAGLLAFGAIWGVNAIRADQAAQAQAAEQAEIAAVQAAEFDALAIKFAAPVTADYVKVPPPPPAPPASEGEGGGDSGGADGGGPALCPPGTAAGAVDAAGNESACYELNDEGQGCVAYDDANNCTQWYKP